MNELVFESGHVFFEAGDAGDRAYLIHEGSVELRIESPQPRTRVVGDGDVFGEMVLVDERRRDATARAVSAGRAVVITREAFESQLLKAPAPIVAVLRAMFERIRSLTGETQDEIRLPDAALAEGGLVEEPWDSAPAGEETAVVEYPVSQGKASEWTVVIHPLTRKAAETLPEEGLLVTRFPLRIGRAAAAGEREAMDLNDLWLLDEEPFNVSRNHCEIFVDAFGPGVRDRGSHLGCVVNESGIGGLARMRRCALEPGENVVVIGSRVSPYQFRVVVESKP